jgi:excisionase family DNA binding protein
VAGMSVADASKALGISKSRVYRLIDRGRLKTLERGQPRGDRGRFTGHGIVVDAVDVERLKEERDGDV